MLYIQIDIPKLYDGFSCRRMKYRPYFGQSTMNIASSKCFKNSRNALAAANAHNH